MTVKISDFDYVGFSGSRHGAPQKLVEGTIAKAHESATFCVGCTNGVDAQVRNWVGDNASLKVFRASEYPGNNYAQKLANRSAGLIQFLHSQPNACLIAFPMAPCPEGVVPCQSWRSAKGSGTWGTIALAVGLGLPTMVYLGSEDLPKWGDRLERVNDRWCLSNSLRSI